MAPPKPAPMAAPRRGKFLSPPSASSPSSSTPNTTSSPSPGTAKTRGKFLGNTSSPSSSAQASTSFGSNAAGGDHITDADSRESLKAHIHTSKIAAASRRKTIAAERDRVMNDLDEAENIVLSLLECASDLSTKLSGMTTSKSRKRHGVKGDEDNNKGNDNTEESFEELTAGVRSNNVGYLAGVKKLHKLLAPHAELVKSYKNHDSGDRSASGSESQSNKTSIAAAVISGAGASDGRQKRTSSKVVEEATSNMYAARVKKRLAMERSEILSEMIRLEELEDIEEGPKSNESNVKSEGMDMDDTKE